MPLWRKIFRHGGQGDLLGGAGGHGRLDEDEAVGPYMVGDDVERFFEGAHLHVARAHVAQVVLRVVELDIDDDNVREFEDIVHVGGDKGLLLKDAPSYHRLDLGVLRLDGRDALVEKGYLPVAPRARPLHAD